MKVLFVIYADTESLREKIDTCHSNPKKSSTAKMSKHTAWGHSLFTHCLFDTAKDKHYRGKDCMKNFCNDLGKHISETINYKKEKIISLTNKENKSYLK